MQRNLCQNSKVECDDDRNGKAIGWPEFWVKKKKALLQVQLYS